MTARSWVKVCTERTNSAVVNGVCTVSTFLYMDCLHSSEGRITKSSDKFHMDVMKNIRRPTELTFSFKAVSCHECGGSFDAEKVKVCPYCGAEYHLEDNNRVVTRLEKA